MQEQRRSSGFADGDVGAGSESAVQAFEGDQVAPIVDDGDDAAGAVFLRLRLGGGNNVLRAVQRQDFLLREVTVSEGDGGHSCEYNRCLHVYSSCYGDVYVAQALLPAGSRLVSTLVSR